MPEHTTPTVAQRPNPTLTRLTSGPLPILGAAVLWGTTGTASSFAPAGAHPAAIGSAGLVLGGILLFLVGRGTTAALLTGSDDRTRARTRGLLLLGATAVAGYPLSFYPAVAHAGVAVGTVITLGSAPVFSGLLAWCVDRARPTARWAAATVAAVLGCAVLVLGPELTGTPTPVNPTGVLLALVAGFSYSLYAIIAEKLIRRGHTSGAVMGTMFAGGGVLVLPVVLATGTAWLATVNGALVALHLALFTVFLAYWLFGHGLRHTPAATATTLSLAEPAVAAVLGVALVGERLPLVSWSGLVILALGLAVLRVPLPARWTKAAATATDQRVRRSPQP
ncbi:DMT family transporter [Nocardiopsis metallicus]|uniref:DME family drug/metabolite transporter n=1 Tax=Nocardiopsis metallicus TaxID=179819 RepID=A0A840WGU5_9ACTN|nr:EamA family transporter [Nocardiopsis metallicus]MBB5491155.1 DME family drug/metabolite transporter [Nocardiopsis metallicus]